MAKMEAVRLTPRLQAIADQIVSGARLADIGTDHAHLPIWLMEHGRIASAVASDIRDGPLARAEENAAKHGCLDRISLRLGRGAGQGAAGGVRCDFHRGHGRRDHCGHPSRRAVDSGRGIICCSCAHDHGG